MNLLVKKCDWKEFVKEHKGVYTWFSGIEFNEWNPFDDFDDENVLGNEEYVYILFRNKEVMFEFEDGLDFAEEDIRLFKTWLNDCYFCSGEKMETYIKYLDEDGDLIQATANIKSQGLTAGKSYLFTENKVIEAHFCPVCGNKL